jgi:hypothetical protein
MRPTTLAYLRALARTESLGRLALVGTAALVPVVGGTAYAMPNGVVKRVVAPIWEVLKSPLDGEDLPAYVLEASLAERRAEDVDDASLAGELAFPVEGARPGWVRDEPSEPGDRGEEPVVGEPILAVYDSPPDADPVDEEEPLGPGGPPDDGDDVAPGPGEPDESDHDPEHPGEEPGIDDPDGGEDPDEEPGGEDPDEGGEEPGDGEGEEPGEDDDGEEPAHDEGEEPDDDGDNGHGNDDDHDDDGNPGNGNGGDDDGHGHGSGGHGDGDDDEDGRGRGDHGDAHHGNDDDDDDDDNV